MLFTAAAPSTCYIRTAIRNADEAPTVAGRWTAAQSRIRVAKLTQSSTAAQAKTRRAYRAKYPQDFRRGF